MRTSIEKCSVEIKTDDATQLQSIKCNHCVHLFLLHIQMCANVRSNNTHSQNASPTRQVLHGLPTSIEKCSVEIKTDDATQLQSIKCNHCVHLFLLHIQMCANVRSNNTHSQNASPTRQVLHGLPTSIEKCSVEIKTDDATQLQSIKCNHCVHLFLLHIQMCANARSNNTHSQNASPNRQDCTVCEHQ